MSLQLLTLENAKTPKGESLGWLTGILYLAPAMESGVMNTCQGASDGCKDGCLFTAGRASVFPEVIKARIRKTQWLASDRAGFLAQLRADIRTLESRARTLGLKPAVRINGTSDLPWIPMQLSAEFPHIQFYDYTKLPHAWTRTRPNYAITFSLHERNWKHAVEALAHGLNVAVVFDVKKGRDLPIAWRGYRVIDGDEHDLRFLDSAGPTIVGLRAKGEAKHDTSGFVQLVRRSAADGVIA